jgi:hypothetical protein
MTTTGGRDITMIDMWIALSKGDLIFPQGETELSDPCGMTEKTDRTV